MTGVVSKWGRGLKARLFRPPYNGVPWAVWFYVITCVACYPHGGVFAGYLAGYDDPVRMTQVLDWVNGGGWYDRRIMRADPPDGFRTIWSRIVDLPIAFVILVAQNFVAQKQAALIAALVVPLIELRIMFAAARYFIRPLVGKNGAQLICLFLLFSSLVNYCDFSVSGFYPGEASHHPWYIILVTALFGAVARVVMGAGSRAPALMISVCIGLLLAVGIEALPLIAAACALPALLGWHDKRPEIMSNAARGFGGGALSGLVLLPLHQPPQDLLTISFAEPSLLGPVLVAVAALFLGIGSWAVKSRPRLAALGIMLLAALFLGSGLIAAFPQIQDGAAAGLSPAERAMAYREHPEARPLYDAASDIYDLAGLYLPLLISIAAGLFCVSRAKSRRGRALALCYLGFGAIGAGISQVFARYYHYAVTFACGWLLWLWRHVKSRLPQNRYYTPAAALAFIALGPFAMLLLPAFGHNAPVLSQVVLFPAKAQSFPEPCGLEDLSRYLDAHYGKDTILLVPGWESSRLLFSTGLTIDFLNNYPSQDRFIDNETFFGTQLPDVARDIAMRHHVDLVAICKITMKPIPLAPGEAPMMLELLESGRPPRWLKPVDIHTRGLYRLYQVDKADLY